MIGNRVEAALNEQIVQEFYASHYYLAMSAYFERTGYPGFAHWMRMQSDEEREHALRIFDFVNDREGRVDLGRIDAPPSEFGSPLEVFRAALAHERKVTSLIGELYRLAVEEADYPTQVMLQCVRQRTGAGGEGRLRHRRPAAPGGRGQVRAAAARDGTRPAAGGG